MTEAKKNQPKPSTLQVYVRPYLEVLFPQKLEEEYWVDEIASYVDFAIPSARVIVQVDGPTHYISDLGGKTVQRPEDEFQDGLLRKQDWKVIRISYLFINSIRNRSEQDKITELGNYIHHVLHSG